MIYSVICSIIGGGTFYVICKYINMNLKHGQGIPPEISKLLILFGFLYGIGISFKY